MGNSHGIRIEKLETMRTALNSRGSGRVRLQFVVDRSKIAAITYWGAMQLPRSKSTHSKQLRTAARLGGR